MHTHKAPRIIEFVCFFFLSFFVFVFISAYCVGHEGRLFINDRRCSSSAPTEVDVCHSHMVLSPGACHSSHRYCENNCSFACSQPDHSVNPSGFALMYRGAKARWDESKVWWTDTTAIAYHHRHCVRVMAMHVMCVMRADVQSERKRTQTTK